MATPLANSFDKALLHLVDIMKRDGSTADDYGVSKPDLVPVALAVPARVCIGKGRTKEFMAEKKSAENWRTIYMRPWVDGAGKPLTTHHWIRFNNQLFDIKQVDDPSGKGHHLEVLCLLTIP
jgi:head-tail adaptor